MSTTGVVVLGGGMPAKCTRMTDEMELPTCTKQPDGTWVAEYPGGGGDGGFAAIFVLMLIVGIGITVWKVSTARRMARDSGMDETDATTMTLLTDDGFEATYLAANLRGQMGAPMPAPADVAEPRSAEQRLRELESLKTQGLVTEEEYAARRRAILDDL